MDHPADVILHSWGEDIVKAFENASKGLFNFMSDLSRVEEKVQKRIVVDAGSYEEALVKYLDAWLGEFSSEIFIGKTFKCVVFDDEDEENIHIECESMGEYFVVGKHQQGTEIKAITWHNLEIYDDDEDKTHIHILVDI